MNFVQKGIELAKEIVNNEEIKDASYSILEDSLNAILGNPVSAGKVFLELSNYPFLLREEMFWGKLSSFLNGVYLSDKDCRKLCAKLEESGNQKDNAVRLLQCIDRAESSANIGFLINATRSVLANYICLDEFFRICHAITHTLKEDLMFLKSNIDNIDVPYTWCVQGLISTGLMYHRVLDGGEITTDGEVKSSQNYSFTPLARLVDQYAVSFDDVDRYPNPTDRKGFDDSPNPIIPNLQWEDMM